MINKLLTSDGDKDQANGERTTNMYLVISTWLVNSVHNSSLLKRNRNLPCVQLFKIRYDTMIRWPSGPLLGSNTPYAVSVAVGVQKRHSVSPVRSRPCAITNCDVSHYKRCKITKPAFITQNHPSRTGSWLLLDADKDYKENLCSQAHHG